MILSDVHTHTTFSSDGISPLSDMVESAKEKGLTYFGISEHFDYDYVVRGVKICGKTLPFIDAEAYFETARREQARQPEGFRLLVGGEYGFWDDAKCHEKYREINEKYCPDFIVNSVHTVDGYDVYFPEYFAGKTKEHAYRAYLDSVRKSLDAPYRYDIVGHLGYVSRNAPYEDRKLRYEDFAKILDEILTVIIKKEKILEVNSSAQGAGSDFLPDGDILKRYFSLGGRLVSFASDAHNSVRIAQNRDGVCAALKKIGFTHITVPDCGKNVPLEI